ncbi:MAG: acyltransferase [Actinomycetaceae bacterium]|nr:acyltransferase [Actinomycetaceae bacterium]
MVDHQAGGSSRSKVLRLDSLTGLRWWAAFGVFAYHFQNVGSFKGSHLAAMGYSGVAFFFVLSGFVLTWSARPETTVRQFWMRRFARIWPAHFVALLLALPVFYPLVPDPANSWEKAWAWGPIIASFFLLHGFSNNILYLFGGNPAAWTLSCEAFFYAVHPALNSVFKKLRTYALPLVMLVALVSGILMRYYADPVAPLLRSWEFVLGMIAALLLKRGIRISLPMPVVYFGLGGVGVVYWALQRAKYFPALGEAMASNWSIVLPVIYTLAIMITASADLDGRASLMRHPIMVRGGEWSYCFYLVHATVLYAFKAAYGARVGIVGFFLLFFAALIVAAALYYLVERPFERRLRRWGDQKLGRPAAATTAGSAQPK